MSRFKLLCGNRGSKQQNVARCFTLNKEICEPHFKGTHELPEEVLFSLQNDSTEIRALYYHLRHLNLISVSYNPSEKLVKECITVLQMLQQKFQPHSHLSSELDAEVASETHTSVKWIQAFLTLNGIEVLERIIMQPATLPLETAACQVEGSQNLVLQSCCIAVLFRLCVEDGNIAKELASKEQLFHGILSLLQYMETCVVACDLIECLLLSRREVLDLTTIPNITNLIARLDNIQLANFCKILAISLSDLDMYEHKTSLYAQCKEKNRDNFSCVRDINQEVILNVPRILNKLVQIACAKPYTPRFPAIAGEMNHWMQWIDTQVTADAEAAEQESEFVGGISQWNPTTVQFQHEAALKIQAEMAFRAEAVYVLGLLLVGKRRKEVQRALAMLRLIPQLSDLFDHFVWKYSTNRDRGRLPGHNINCECSPEVALKIQVLRLVHSFCEHAEYKHVMLSWSEYSALKRSEDPKSTDTQSLERSLMCTGSKGLLTKIVEVLKKEAGSSTFRFWLSRAIESYLRGCTSSADQDFLLSMGLLQLVAGNMVNSNVRQKEVLQSSFDLLGELVKFNVRAFHQLDKIISTEAKQKKLIQLMNSHLVDSNMFVRSLVLSQEHLVASKDDEIKDYAERRSYVLSHIGEQRTRVRYLKKLISLVNISNLTQENVSCVNTALVLLVFAQQRGELVSYLGALQATPASEGSTLANKSYLLACNQGGSELRTQTVAGSPTLLQNLLELLHFWQEHYLHKDKDCSALEKSSRISFHRWKAMVNTLVSGELATSASLVHHVPAGPSTRDS